MNNVVNQALVSL